LSILIVLCGNHLQLGLYSLAMREAYIKWELFNFIHVGGGGGKNKFTNIENIKLITNII